MRWWLFVVIFAVVFLATPFASAYPQIFCQVPTPDVEVCGLPDDKDDSYELAKCENVDSEGCCTIEGERLCSKKWYGNDNWASRNSQDVNTLCPASTCNDGTRCLSQGLLSITSQQTEIVGDITCERVEDDPDCIVEHGREICERQGALVCDIETQTVNSQVYDKETICAKSASDPTATNLPALYTCTSTRYRETFNAQSINSKLCCTVIDNKYAFKWGACLEVCGDGKDNDGDGKTDNQDSDCTPLPPDGTTIRWGGTIDTKGSDWTTIDDTQKSNSVDCSSAPEGADKVCNTGDLSDPNSGCISQGVMDHDNEAGRPALCATSGDEGGTAAARFTCSAANAGKYFMNAEFDNIKYCCDRGSNVYEWVSDEEACDSGDSAGLERYNYAGKAQTEVANPYPQGTSNMGSTEWNSIKSIGTTECSACEIGGSCFTVNELYSSAVGCFDTIGTPASYRCSTGINANHTGNKLESQGTQWCCTTDGWKKEGEEGFESCDSGAEPPNNPSCPTYCGTNRGTSCASPTSYQSCSYSACVEGACVYQCTTPVQCEGLKVCSSGACVCPTGTTLNGGECVESNCANNKDDDGNGEADYDGGTTGLHGDVMCPVSIVGIDAPSTVDTVGACNEEITITCSSTPSDVRSITASLAGMQCAPNEDKGWYDNKYDFTCAIPNTDGTLTARCTVDDEKSYQSGNDATKQVNVDCRRTVTGTVTDEHNLFVSQAQITAGSLNANTKSDGTYTIPNVYVGERDFTAEKEGYESAHRTDEVVIREPHTVDFQLLPIQCTDTGTCSRGGFCDYGCSDCDFSALDPSDLDRVKLLCNNAPNTSVRQFNDTHKVQCCTGPLKNNKDFETPLNLKSCSSHIVPHQTLVQHDGELVQLTVITYQSGCS